MKLYFSVPSLCVDPIQESKFSFLAAAGLSFFFFFCPTFGNDPTDSLSESLVKFPEHPAGLG